MPDGPSTAAPTDAYERARERARAKVGFYSHLAVYVVINAILAGVNLAAGTRPLWFLYPLVGWGVAIVLHFLGVFVFGEGTAFQERMVRRELRRGAR